MTWQHLLRTMLVAGVAALALMVAQQAHAAGGESAAARGAAQPLHPAIPAADVHAG